MNIVLNPFSGLLQNNTGVIKSSANQNHRLVQNTVLFSGGNNTTKRKKRGNSVPTDKLTFKRKLRFKDLPNPKQSIRFKETKKNTLKALLFTSIPYFLDEEAFVKKEKDDNSFFKNLFKNKPVYKDSNDILEFTACKNWARHFYNIHQYESYFSILKKSSPTTKEDPLYSKGIIECYTGYKPLVLNAKKACETITENLNDPTISNIEAITNKDLENLSKELTEQVKQLMLENKGAPSREKKEKVILKAIKPYAMAYYEKLAEKIEDKNKQFFENNYHLEIIQHNFSQN